MKLKQSIRYQLADFIGPVIIVCALAIGVVTIARDAGMIATAQQVLGSVKVTASCKNWVLSGFLYSGFMAFMIIPFIAQLGHSAQGSRKSGMLGGACGAWYASIVGLGATGTGVTGIFGILLHLHMPLQYIIMMAISFGVSFAVTWVIWSPEEVKV